MCTSIYWLSPSGPILANNEDIFLETGMLFTNQRGIAKQALLFPPETPLAWISRFGSLVFSQCGKEFPSAGMNEAGLAIEQTTLRETRYPAADSRPALNELQLIQYLLDTCATVDEAVARVGQVRVTQSSAPIHYLLVDQSGAAALLEFLDGRLVTLPCTDLPIRAITNSTYADSLRSLSQPELNSHPADDYQQDSLRRFQIAADWSQMSLADDAIGTAFQALKAASRPDTIWNIVYELSSRSVHIQTRWNSQIRRVDLHSFDFSPTVPGLIYDLHAAGVGDISADFVPYTTAINHTLVISFFRNPTIMQLFGFALPDEVLDGFAAYPQSLQPA